MKFTALTKQVSFSSNSLKYGGLSILWMMNVDNTYTYFYIYNRISKQADKDWSSLEEF